MWPFRELHPRPWQFEDAQAWHTLHMAGAQLMVGPSSQHWAQRAAGLTSQGDNASWAQVVCGAEREQWGTCSLIVPFTLLQLSALGCVLWRDTVALAAEGKANRTCQSPLLLSTVTDKCSVWRCLPGHWELGACKALAVNTLSPVPLAEHGGVSPCVSQSHCGSSRAQEGPWWREALGYPGRIRQQLGTVTRSSVMHKWWMCLAEIPTWK